MREILRWLRQSVRWDHHRRLARLLFCVGVLAGTALPGLSSAQYEPPPPPEGTVPPPPEGTVPPPPPPGSAPPPPPGAETAPADVQFGPAQLEQMLAPIALYPDDLLGQILMASTYPLEVVQADRWLQDPQNAALRGDALAQALQPLPWDRSVKSLVAYPQILSMMDSNLEWTETLGDAFLSQQAAVLDSVQRLRSRAQAAGRLGSNAQQNVTGSAPEISISSGDASVEYVPVYDPQLAYGPWPYPDFPPAYFYVPGYDVGAVIAYPILVPFWGWDRPDWPHHTIDIDDQGGGRVAKRPVPWRHEPIHRAGVPYLNAGTSAQFQAPGAAARHDFRGYPAAPAPRNEPAFNAPAPYHRAAPSPAPTPAPQPPRMLPQPEPRPVPPVEHVAPPVMESFGRGETVHAQEMRGASSRMSTPSGGGARGKR